MHEFKINEFITLELVHDKTFIYVKGREFIQCSYILLNKKIEELKELESIESVDGMERQFDKRMETSGGENVGIPPETEFWAHCSNLQVWAENQYDTLMLHRNIAFPLLRRLTEAGDPVARRVFKEEIAKRFESGFEPVVKFLIIEDYMEYFSSDELDVIGENSSALKTLDLSDREFEPFPEIITNLRHLEKLILNHSWLITLPASMSRLHSLQTLSLGYNRFLVIPESIIYIPNLTALLLYHNQLKTIPDNIGNMKHIQHLSLDDNRIQTIPDSFINLRDLTFLNLDNNQFKEFPEILTKLTWLETIDINRNQIDVLPDSIGNLGRIRVLELSGNNIANLPESIGGLTSLEYLWLEDNQIQTLPEAVYHLSSLKFIALRNNPLKNKNEIKERLLNCGVEFKV